MVRESAMEHRMCGLYLEPAAITDADRINEYLETFDASRFSSCCITKMFNIE